MLDLAIILLFIMGFFIGLKRGFILQFIHLIGFIVAYIVAYKYYDILAPRLKLWVPYPSLGETSPLSVLTSATGAEDAFYRAFAFIAIFIAVKVLIQIIGAMLDFLAHLPIIKHLNIWAGGALGFLEVYLILFLLLYIGALVPMGFIQEAMKDSVLAEGMIKHTPVLSQQLKEWWIDNIAA
ncbi:hypothetical protein AM500_08115 [Bacillus sp. FJAT-18017]|jgi:uncharacterized membrane protein required for colicin V production|uniref:CvpA family protein n=1 Tax=unclassified Bacillus (in: firmicutes) TaxID=185979 RepID=UPI0005C4C05F|nr:MULTISPECIES: CvpA family protein [unclassified Bacillus (in: firmicutes)]ALC89737.1 hypothetical protein AM500_08115 [Bacillus sp. FJAT-18017]